MPSASCWATGWAEIVCTNSAKSCNQVSYLWHVPMTKTHRGRCSVIYCYWAYKQVASTASCVRNNIPFTYYAKKIDVMIGSNLGTGILLPHTKFTEDVHKHFVQNCRLLHHSKLFLSLWCDFSSSVNHQSKACSLTWTLAMHSLTKRCAKCSIPTVSTTHHCYPDPA